jgi:hypothetical protein
MAENIQVPGALGIFRVFLQPWRMGKEKREDTSYIRQKALSSALLFL